MKKCVLVLVAVIYVTVTGAAGPGARRPSECMSMRPKVKPTECCEGTDLISAEDLSECQAEYPDREDVPKHFGNPCVLDCYFNKTGIFVDGSPVKSAALDILGRGADAEITSLLNDSLDMCILIHQEHKARMKERMNQRSDESRPPRPQGMPPSGEMDKKRCRPDAKFFSKCVQMQIFNNCPAGKFSSTDECAELKKFADKCMPPM